jgi:uncharacterized membrane protein YoaK (UPF0700 family)
MILDCVTVHMTGNLVIIAAHLVAGQTANRTLLLPVLIFILALEE